MATSPIVTSGFKFSTSLVVTAGFLSSTPTPPPPPTPSGTVVTQTFTGFGGGFLGPHYKRKREEIYAKAELFGPPPVFRFNRRDLLPAIAFAIPLPDDPLLEMAAKAEPATRYKGYSIKGLSRVKLTGLNEYYDREKKRQTKKRQQEEDELMLML